MNSVVQKPISNKKKELVNGIMEDNSKSYLIYEVGNLLSARIFLNITTDKVILTNPEGSTRYYGMRVVDYIFNQLKQEFPNKIVSVIVNAYDDYSAFITAKQLGYKNIKYVNIK